MKIGIITPIMRNDLFGGDTIGTFYLESMLQSLGYDTKLYSIINIHKDNEIPEKAKIDRVKYLFPDNFYSINSEVDSLIIFGYTFLGGVYELKYKHQEAATRSNFLNQIKIPFAYSCVDTSWNLIVEKAIAEFQQHPHCVGGFTTDTKANEQFEFRSPGLLVKPLLFYNNFKPLDENKILQFRVIPKINVLSFSGRLIKPRNLHILLEHSETLNNLGLKIVINGSASHMYAAMELTMLLNKYSKFFYQGVSSYNFEDVEYLIGRDKFTWYVTSRKNYDKFTGRLEYQPQESIVSGSLPILHRKVIPSEFKDYELAFDLEDFNSNRFESTLEKFIKNDVYRLNVWNALYENYKIYNNNKGLLNLLKLLKIRPSSLKKSNKFKLSLEQLDRVFKNYFKTRTHSTNYNVSMSRHPKIDTITGCGYVSFIPRNFDSLYKNFIVIKVIEDLEMQHFVELKIRKSYMINFDINISSILLGQFNVVKSRKNYNIYLAKINNELDILKIFNTFDKMLELKID